MQDILGFEGLYAISEDGRVWSHNKKWNSGNGGFVYHNGKFLKLKPKHGGYLDVILRKNKKVYKFSVHRLVAQAFIPEKDLTKQVHHKNGDPSDNRVENLEWLTQSENLKERDKKIGYIPCPTCGKPQKQKMAI